MPVDRAGIEDGVRRLFAAGIGEDCTQVREFLGDRADQSDGHSSH
jgi:hypothetical protein